jgi:hypothetical protein
MARHNVQWLLGVLCVALFTLSGVGCNKVTPGSVRDNYSPDLETTTLNAGQRKNRAARTLDLNVRQFNDDFDRHILMLDRPSRLTRYPVP